MCVLMRTFNFLLFTIVVYQCHHTFLCITKPSLVLCFLFLMNNHNHTKYKCLQIDRNLLLVILAILIMKLHDKFFPYCYTR